MRITYFFRHPKVGFSIQRVLQTINKDVAKTQAIEEVFLPEQKSGILSIIKNGIYAKKHQGSINHITGDAHYLLYFLKSKKTIVTVHDIMYYSYLSGFKKKIWKFLYISSLKRASKVVFISEFAKEQVLNEIYLKPDQYCVIPNPVSTDFKYLQKDFCAAKPIILHINGNLERKNLARTIKALDKIPCHLRIVGKLSDNNTLLLQQSNVEYSNVFNLSNKEVVKEYENCDIVNFPSLFEGFGMPIIEGQAVGRPVLTSNILPMKSVAGEGAVLVNPESVESIKNGYIKIITNENFRNNLVNKGVLNVKRFQLNTVTDLYLDLYKNLN
ncbi:MAG TPA: glycosyltransferase family 1 protein [Maribacter sp.]|uniref:glycosyltransferase family 4 protein n=1 Tax=unclassified Maribacter TaxID=2615042 RepID=UPI000EEA3010|nr:MULTISPECIES: glycosyltransferase family 1 protein [unclassified Maribacter]HAF77824.1 glycosyltransferase family 1 protein [Maribacter sp.]|tara:strand:- start:123536 stop:124516 length:981 start_codon:yes stop_codon:yes gene_type:complete